MLTPRQTKLLDTAVEVEVKEAGISGSVGFMARMFILASLPHRDPGDVPVWQRRNGKYSLTIQPSMTIDESGQPTSIGFPFGTLPRLILVWLSTEAVRTKDPVINLGTKLSKFMCSLGMESTGGKNGTITRLYDQMERLFSSTISCVYAGDDSWENSGFRIADASTCLWWKPLNLKNTCRSGNLTVELGSKFFTELLNHPVPVDRRVVKALQQSPLAVDIYTWLTFRMSYLRKDTLIPWESLQDQFGSEYNRRCDFKVNFKKCLRKVCTFYPAANVTPLEVGLLLKPSKTHIRRSKPCG